MRWITGWVLVACAALPLEAAAAKVYRCPDGSYADKPCGEGARVVTTTKRYSTTPDADRECVAVADDAEEIAQGKAGGLPVEKALKRVDESGLPYEKRTLRKKVIVKIYQMTGSPAEVRSVVEADCVTDKKAAAKAAAQPAPSNKAGDSRPAEPAPAAPAASNEAARKQCEDMKKQIDTIRRSLAQGADAESIEQMKQERRTMEKEMAGLCPQ